MPVLNCVAPLAYAFLGAVALFEDRLVRLLLEGYRIGGRATGDEASGFGARCATCVHAPPRSPRVHLLLFSSTLLRHLLSIAL